MNRPAMEIPMDGKSRLSLWRAAYVIARRDFTAILFSKAFLFFLLGPIFFLGISGGAGMLGKRAAERAQDPRLAVAMAPADQAAFVSAHDRLGRLTPLPDIVVASAKQSANPRTMLDDSKANVAAVLVGTLQQPQLIGPKARIQNWRGEVALISAYARGNGASDYPEVLLQPTASSAANERSNNAAIATASLTLLFLLTMLLAGMVLSNLVEEKGNKIIEILAAAIPMDAVFLGKLFAMLAISFVGIAVWGGLVGSILLLGAKSLGPVPSPAVGWPIFSALFLIYFAMAYLLIGSIFLAVGSLAPTVRDVQTISMPATILQLMVFFLATYAINDLGSPVEIVAVIFPLSSPYAMLGRAAQLPALWPHIVAIIWQILATALLIKGGAALFRKRVMKSGPQGSKTSARRRSFLSRWRKDQSQTATHY